MGIASAVCMPDGAPISKVEATKALGAQVCLVKGSYDDAYEKACQLQKESGATFIHPFDDEAVIAGQGTIGLEIIEQLPDVEAVICPIAGKKTVCIFSGGNIDVTILSRVITRGLLMSGRSCQLNIELVDKPGQLMKVSRIIAEQGGNVTAVHHEHSNEGSDVNGCYLRLTLETKNFEHIEKIKNALTNVGIKMI